MSAVTIDTERVALSNELQSLGERFALESTMWVDRGCREQLEHDARLLATIGRAVLTDADLDKAQAFADVASRVIGNVEGCRRFFRTILTPPRG